MQDAEEWAAHFLRLKTMNSSLLIMIEKNEKLTCYDAGEGTVQQSWCKHAPSIMQSNKQHAIHYAEEQRAYYSLCQKMNSTLFMMRKNEWHTINDGEKFMNSMLSIRQNEQLTSKMLSQIFVYKLNNT